MNKLSTFIIGDGTLARQCAEILLRAGHELRGIISANQGIRDWANENRIQCAEPTSNLSEFFGDNPFDYLFSIANLRILPDEIVHLPRQGAINFHDGPLPRYAGLHATSWALMNREKTHGVTWHLMTNRVDTGDILEQREFEISDRETAFSLNTKCYEAAIASFAALIENMAAGRINLRKQNPTKRTYFSASKRPAAASVISWEQCAHDIMALVQALDFGPYANPVGVAKFAVGSTFVTVSEVLVLDSTSEARPGTVTRITPNSLTVATASQDMTIRKVMSITGKPLSMPEFIATFGLYEGLRLPLFDQEMARRADELNAEISQHETFWVERLTEAKSITLPYVKPGEKSGSQYESALISLPEEVNAFLDVCQADCGPADFLLAAFAAYLTRIGGTDCFDLGFQDVGLSNTVSGLNELFAAHVPLRIETNPGQSAIDFIHGVQEQLQSTRRHKTYARDVVFRYPNLRSNAELKVDTPWRVTADQVEDLDIDAPVQGQQLRFMVQKDGSACRLVYDNQILDADSVIRMVGQFTTILRSIVVNPDQRLATAALLSESERQQVTGEWNETSVPFASDQCIHQLFEAQVARTPDVVAIVCEDEELTYQQLNARSNQLARHLRQAGIGPDVLVGLYVERSLLMMVGLLGILKAGGAYVPLDPTYPRDRLSFMLEDSGVPVILTQEHLKQNLPAHGAHAISIDRDWARIDHEDAENLDTGARPNNLAYVMYTSGSTGKPKGVMVEHRNVVNFFTGMDQRIGGEPVGAWLAVTSISFDISVLELFWTLARGFKVVIHTEDDKAVTSAPAARTALRPMEFSLSYFASDDSANLNGDKYRLLIEGAKFADSHDFAAIWTPERHFHPFGGLYPNPSVTSAFLAGITERIQLRAGSVVLPLHNSIRVAEEWSVVDNLSHGRVGISVASGWHDRDFAFAPENYTERKEVMAREITTVRRLWSGEAIKCRGGAGNEVEIRIYPQPVQPELPIWVTAAGGPETFKLAGELGANVLTHLLFQSMEEIAGKIAIYREAWRKAGHGPSGGHVTIMLHTFVSNDLDEVRERVRTPFTEYLRSSVDLIKKLTTGVGNELSSKDLTDDDHEALLAHAFERYFQTSGLFGTPETCRSLIERLQEIGVDEVACLVDFGVEVDAVLSSLSYLDQLRRECNETQEVPRVHTPMAEQLVRHNITHMQCTPSTARMLTASPESLAALRPLRKLLLGGEALPPTLAKQLTNIVLGEILNMYGPTETTIWSTTHLVGQPGDSVPIGRPIANTEVYILDKNFQPAPIGAAGELMIGGAGVVRGYFNRPDLTAQRFIPNPFSDDPEARLYRTGDLASYLSDGTIAFLGRMDHQVKVRGYRIELGEIEGALEQHRGVREAFVNVYEPDAGDKRLVAYLTRNGQPAPSLAELRGFLKMKLPDFMVPATFIFLAAFPLTPNGKIDRKALPAPGSENERENSYVAPRDDVEVALAGIWSEVLRLDRLGIDDNFFELGGDSILAVQIIARAHQQGLSLSVRNLLDRQTIRELARITEATNSSPEISDLVAVSAPASARQFTPADFPLANLTQEKLNKLSMKLTR